METRRIEDDWNALRGIAVVVAAIVNLLEIGRIIELVVELERFGEMRVCINAEVVELGADSIRANQID